jgi:hypothetical protein
VKAQLTRPRREPPGRRKTAAGTARVGQGMLEADGSRARQSTRTNCVGTTAGRGCGAHLHFPARDFPDSRHTRQFAPARASADIGAAREASANFALARA